MTTSINFDKAFETVIGHEGGYVNDPEDPGGETKYGITKRTYPHLDIKNLTLEQAKAIYKKDFWDKARVTEITRLYDLQMLLFDIAVNHGVKDSAVFLQRALGVDDDGVIGPITLAAAKEANKRDLIARINGYRLLDYAVTLKNMFPRYGRGWTIRTAENLVNVGRSGQERMKLNVEMET